MALEELQPVSQEEFGDALITVLRFAQENCGGAFSGVAEYGEKDGDEAEMFHVDIHNVKMCGTHGAQYDKRTVQ